MSQAGSGPEADTEGKSRHEGGAEPGTGTGDHGSAESEAGGEPVADADAEHSGAPEVDAGDESRAGAEGESEPGSASRVGSEPGDGGEPVADADARRSGAPEVDAGDESRAEAEGGAEADSASRDGSQPGDGGDGDGEVDAGGESAGGAASEGTTGEAAAGGEQSEAAAEIAAQRALREKIAERKAAKEGPIAAGGKLSGTAADLLAAVRAVESGERPVATFSEPAPAPRKVATEPVRRTPAAAPARPAEPGAEAVDAVRAVLAEGGAPAALAAPAAAVLGEGADGALREDPWQLLRVAGVRPEQADGFARALLGAECRPDDERRGRAVTVWLLEQAAVAGHTALDAPLLADALGKRAVPDPDEAVQSAIAEGDALVFQDALEEAPGATPAPAQEDGEEVERPVRVLVGLERYALAEESLADGLARLVNSLSKDDGSQALADWEPAAAAAGGSTGELIRAVAGHGLVLHTGAEAARAEPAALVQAAARLGLRVCAAAHSVDGRRRLSEFFGPSAPEGTSVTVAGLLSGAEGPGRDQDGALAVDLLVVLDAPQLDVETAAMLAESLADGARLVLSGDPAVLWSAGPGRVFADLLAARVCPQIASRTPDPGPVGELVSGIAMGELTQVEAPGKEVVIVPVRDAAEAIHRTVQLVADSVPRAIGIPSEQTQVITPGHGGAAGTRALNAALKERLNPGPGRFGGFDPGDRIAYVPAPGRTVPGRVVRADAEGLHLDCAGEPVVVPQNAVERTVRHGWALTAHQAVGLRWPAAVVVLPGDATQALSRPWVYTAFGRGERHLSVVHGADAALPHAVAEIPPKPRTTRLGTLLRAQVPPTQ
ncbi:helix-hairpin-helix domain-containing protein [Streptomyces sp. NPDC046821]|uniref:helix-hairpin-helix domain-containing protein n=1 Tax=Streptomyces sp. NPDC046821 TaxID=3154702 RepID=UPI0033F7CA33